MNFVDSNGNTPLHIAMKYNYKECVKCLLTRGSRKDLPNNEGQKPVDINRSNNYDEETIKMVENFDCSTMGKYYLLLIIYLYYSNYFNIA